MNGMTWHKTGMHGQLCAERGLHHQWISIDMGPVQLISQDSTELATIPAHVDGHSDVKETVPGTAAFVAVLTQQSNSSTLVILSRAMALGHRYHLSMGGFKVFKMHMYLDFPLSVKLSMCPPLTTIHSSFTTAVLSL